LPVTPGPPTLGVRSPQGVREVSLPVSHRACLRSATLPCVHHECTARVGLSSDG
jgi:hypothetical protein